MIISLDCETTGVDLFHGAKPFLVTTCNDRTGIQFYEWNVDPLTREPIIPQEDYSSLKKMIEDTESIVLHNSKFDVHALQTILPDLQWDWTKTHDTLAAAHVLASNEPKDLTTLSAKYLRHNIKPLEKKIEQTVKEATKIVRKFFPSWRLAERNLPEMPSAKQKVWKFDMWLPKAVATRRNHPPNDHFHTDLAAYANKDSECTLAIWQIMEYRLKKEGLWQHYLFQMDSIRIAFEMECRGLTFSHARSDQLRFRYIKRSFHFKRECVSLAEKEGYEIHMPKKGLNDSVRDFLINGLKLPPVYNKKKKRTFDKKEAMPFYLKTLEPESNGYKFIRAHLNKSHYDTSLAYLKDYLKYGRSKPENPDTILLRPNANPVGTKTTRWGMKNPNGQNLSTQKDEDGYTTRYIFGPEKDREWWSFDAKNIERRIPDYESGEPEMIALYEKDKEPPFYGSFHIVVFSVIYEELWHQALKIAGPTGAKDYVTTEFKQQYKCTKNFNFAVQYGSGEANADLTAKRPGAYKLIAQRFTRLNKLNQFYIAQARQKGYVETLPLRNRGWEKGYPLVCTKTENGGILTTVPLSYHVQGTAMLLTCNGMHKVDAQLQEWRKTGWDGYITMQVHDELVLDVPRRAHPKENPRQSNLGRMRVIQRILESGGQDFVPSLPTPFGCAYHSDNWSKEVAF